MYTRLNRYAIGVGKTALAVGGIIFASGVITGFGFGFVLGAVTFVNTSCRIVGSYKKAEGGVNNE